MKWKFNVTFERHNKECCWYENKVRLEAKLRQWLKTAIQPTEFFFSIILMFNNNSYVFECFGIHPFLILLYFFKCNEFRLNGLSIKSSSVSSLKNAPSNNSVLQSSARCLNSHFSKISASSFTESDENLGALLSGLEQFGNTFPMGIFSCTL